MQRNKKVRPTLRKENSQTPTAEPTVSGRQEPPSQWVECATVRQLLRLSLNTNLVRPIL